MLPAETAELREFQPLRRLLLVLRRAVIASLALGARQRDEVSHGASAIPSGSLFYNLGHRAGADRSAALTDGEARARFERNRRHQLAGDLRVVARHHHLDALRQL